MQQPHYRVQRIGRLVFIACLVLIGIALAPSARSRLAQFRYESSRPDELPLAQPAEEVTPDVDPAIEDSDSSEPELGATSALPDALNYAVPFTSQAPLGVWDEHHEEYCEEASALMVGRFFAGRSIEGPADADAALLELERWQLDHFGYFQSTTAGETASMIREMYGLIVTLDTTVSAEHLKQVLDEGNLVIVPAAGRELGNPFFKTPGPVYHMLVVKGYTNDGRFITNDPGTRRGADYLYAADTLINAIGDYNGGDPVSGQKVILTISR